MSTNTFSHEAIFCIVNIGYSEVVMEAAKKVGARGGTVINARGTAGKEAEAFFGVAVQPEKEIVMILVPAKHKDKILSALYDEVGLDTAGQGIAFSLPVDSVVGVSEEPAKIAGDTEASKKQQKPQQEQLRIE